MTQKWRFVDAADFQGRLDYRRGQLLVGNQPVPMTDISVVLVGSHAHISPAAIAGAARFDVHLVHVDWRHRPISITMPWSPHSHIATRQIAQAHLSKPRQKNAHMRIVKAKIHGQANTLTPYDSRVAQRLREVAATVRSGDPTNVEAQAARSYWTALFQHLEFTRTPRASEGINALLDYGYAILRTRCLRAIVTAGLSPTLGLWHRTRDNPFVLADDLMEPFRPATDASVAALPANATLTDPGVKATLVAVLSQPMSGTAGPTVASAMDTLATVFAQYVLGETEALNVPVWAN